MKVNIEEPNPGIFFPWPGAKTDKDGGITIHALTNEMLSEIDSLTTKKKRKFRGNVPYDDITIDEKRREELMWDYCIISWENLQDNNGKELPCTAENKTFLMRKDFKFSIFVADCIDQLIEFVGEQKETERKNSSTS